ncbi:MAG: cobalamin-dependent protein [Anaerosomatales bacterium]|nr:cobalamin-dependent protein [Anaerosomatales bacterium]
MTADTLRSELESLIASRDRAGALRRALDAVGSGEIPIPVLHERVLAPLLIRVGSRWQQGAEEVWEEHYASAVVRTIVEAVAPIVAELAEKTERAGAVLLACPPEEYHDLGLRMLADRFALAGWDVVFLGADLPVAQTAAAARETGADLVVLSAATHYHRLRLREHVDTLRALLPQARVLVGGAAFAHGHEGWEPDELLDADALLGDLGETDA